jgi:hypothetical protein
MKSYQVFESATIALYAEKTMFQQSASRIEGICGIHRERKLVAKFPHWKDGTGMKEGFAQ